MIGAGNFFVRWRVRLGYPLAIAVLYFSRPTPPRILLGALTGVIGLWVRAYAAGYLQKQEVLTVTGPYAFTRTPLYLGSAILISVPASPRAPGFPPSFCSSISQCSTPLL